MALKPRHTPLQSPSFLHFLGPITVSRQVMPDSHSPTYMALEGKGRYTQSEASRSLIYISQRLVRDSQFPFQNGEQLTVRIDRNRLIVESKESEG